MALRPPETVSTRTQMETTMSNSSEDKLNSGREITADELNQVTGGLGPILIFRGLAASTANFGDIPGEQTDKPHCDGGCMCPTY
jgi:bacteriocin-like protein